MDKKVAYHNNINLKDEIKKEEMFFIFEIKYNPNNISLTTPDIHRHPFYELIVVTKGNLTLDVDFKTYELTRGSLALFSPSQIHHPMKSSEDYEGYLVRFYPNMFDNQDFFNEIDVFEYDYVKFNEDQYPRAKMLLQELVYEFKNSQLLKNFALGNLLKCFLIAIQRAIPNVVKEKSYNTTFSKLNFLIVENEFKIAKPSDYADKLKISARSLNSIVKEHVDLSAGEYIRSKTIFEAQRLLSYTPLTIKEIAYKLGFDDVAYFSRFFKKSENISPAQFREDFLSKNK
ncbi:helix-turn-helix domain-containing protein [Arcobacter arenosus]|jgi:AraC-like DNA-binding protein|uniref:helix-turn-helix domain-containing protein n=1 Tax=Arcobacter arenosus TaxID=2576037 RepID=UPI003BA88FBD